MHYGWTYEVVICSVELPLKQHVKRDYLPKVLRGYDRANDTITPHNRRAQSLALCNLTFTPSPGASVMDNPFLGSLFISSASMRSKRCNSLTITKLASLRAYCSALVSHHQCHEKEWNMKRLTTKTDSWTTRESHHLPLHQY